MIALLQNEVVTKQSLWEFLASGGPVMIPIGLCSVVAFGLAMERYLRVRRGRICPSSMREAVAALQQGRFDDAHALAEKSRSPAGRILLAGLRRRGFTLEEVERVMEDQGRKELDRLHVPIRPIAIIANVAPLLGLLGTVLGIAEAFHQVVLTGMGKPENLAAGIEVALTTTIAGLIVAIPAMLVAAHLGGRVRRLMLHTDDVLAPAVEPLAARPAAEDSDAA